MRTKKHLFALAEDLYKGNIFTNFQLESKEEACAIFTPLLIMTEEDRQKLKDLNVCMIFEYINRAGPRTVNRKPQFTSFQTLTKDEFDIFSNYYKRIVFAIEDIKSSIEEETTEIPDETKPTEEAKELGKEEDKIEIGNDEEKDD